MVEDVKELRSELELETLHQANVLEGRKIYIFQSRPVESVAPRIPHKHSIRYRWSYNKAACVEVGHAPVDGVTSRNEVRKIHREVSVEPGIERIAASPGCHRKGRTASRGDDGAEFPPPCQVRREARLGAGHVPDESTHNDLPHIKVTGSDSILFAQKKRHGDRIGVGVAGNWSRTGVPALAIGVRQLALQARTHGFLELSLKALIGGLAVKQNWANSCAAGGARSDATIRAGPVRIELIGIRGDNNACGSHNWRNKVDIVGSDRQVNGARPHIAQEGGPGWHHLALDIEVPVQDRGALGVLVYVSVPDAVRVKTHVGVDAASETRIGIKTYNLIRSRCRRVEAELVGQGQHVKHRKSPTHGCFTTAKGIPGETNARLEVLGGGITCNKTADVNWAARAGEAGRNARSSTIYERGDLLDSVVRIFGEGCELVTQTQVQREIGPRPPIVLDISGHQTLADRDLIRSSWSQRVEPVRDIVQQV